MFLNVSDYLWQSLTNYLFSRLQSLGASQLDGVVYENTYTKGV
jgi:hypothetical protein